MKLIEQTRIDILLDENNGAGAVLFPLYMRLVGEDIGFVGVDL